MDARSLFARGRFGQRGDRTTVGVVSFAFQVFLVARHRSAERKQELRREATARRAIGYEFPESRRYRERSTAKRVNSRLKDELGGRHLRVRGHGTAFCHLKFGILALSVSQLLRLQI